MISLGVGATVFVVLAFVLLFFFDFLDCASASSDETTMSTIIIITNICLNLFIVV